MKPYIQKLSMSKLVANCGVNLIGHMILNFSLARPTAHSNTHEIVDALPQLEMDKSVRMTLTPPYPTSALSSSLIKIEEVCETKV